MGFKSACGKNLQSIWLFREAGNRLRRATHQHGPTTLMGGAKVAKLAYREVRIFLRLLPS